MTDARDCALARTEAKTCRKASERGSALLIVFVFAAVLAITLYMEMPVAAFEAQRQKEELLIARGDEYAHAVKLYVRKLGSFPASIDALENTNRMRFLRHRFADPLTGKDDWRLLHAGPGGALIDSKVNPIPGVGQAGTGGSNSNGSTPSVQKLTDANGNSAYQSASSNSDSTDVPTVAAIPQRPPAVPANTGGQDTVSNPETFQDPTAPLLQAGQTSPASASAGSGTASPGNAVMGAVPAMDVNAGVSAANPNQVVQNLLANPNPAGQQTTTQTPTNAQTPGATQANASMGTIMGGGIAGVASKAVGHSIKTVNDQSNYSLWEFYYDPSKDASRGLANALAGMGAQTGSATQTAQGAAGTQGAQTAAMGTNNGTTSGTTDSNQPATLTPIPIRMPGGIPSNNGIALTPAPGTENTNPPTTPTDPQ